jgi:hypothetical protein
MSDPSPLRRSGCGCDSFRPGHNCHVIQARLANSDPESWFVSTATEVNGDEVVVAYDDGTTCRLWRHGGFDERMTLAASVLVCEAWSVTSVVDADLRVQLSVEVRAPSWRKNSLPEDRLHVATSGVVSNETGEGIDIVHARSRSRAPGRVNADTPARGGKRLGGSGGS